MTTTMAEHTDLIQSAFAQDLELRDRVLVTAKQCRDQWQLFVDIARYIHTRSNGPTPAAGPTTKKRKIDSEEDSNPLTQQSTVKEHPRSHLADLSFSIPVRKKLSVEVLGDYTPSTSGLRIAATTPDGTSHTIAWNQIIRAFRLPVPEKQIRATYFCLFLSDTGPFEQVLWTSACRPVKDKISPGDDVSCSEVLERGLAACGKSFDEPDPDQFASVVVQSHRKDERAYHVKAHVGTKDGYLFFLPSGIFFGFRKPCLFYPFDAVESISYTSVLQRTFNLVISTNITSTGPQDVEFSMLDQADFGGIDDYIRRHGLNDASMAAERRAKRFKGNGSEMQTANGRQETEVDESEIQKVERELQDQEDEKEEDYDPGSEGESEGEGESSDDEHGGREDESGEDDVGEHDGRL